MPSAPSAAPSNITVAPPSGTPVRAAIGSKTGNERAVAGIGRACCNKDVSRRRKARCAFPVSTAEALAQEPLVFVRMKLTSV